MGVVARSEYLERTLHVLDRCTQPRSLERFRETVLDALVQVGFDAGLFWLTPPPDGVVNPTDATARCISPDVLDRYLAGPCALDPFLSARGVRAMMTRPVVLIRELVSLVDEDHRAYIDGFFVPHGYRDQATMWLPTDLSQHGFVTVVCQRRIIPVERELLTRLRPHLAALLRWQLLAGRGAPGLEGLSPREREVAERAMTGASNREIATALGISQETVKKHLTRIYAALGCRSRAQLAASYRPGTWTFHP
jgi:DNA-binding CsgD family transcriptional regulator